jgi:acetyl-CoA synthetase
MPSDATQAFRAARDFLLAHRDDYAASYAGFQWRSLIALTGRWTGLTRLPPAIAATRPRCGWPMKTVARTKLTFAELSERSNRIANYFRGVGVKRGDRVLLMLGTFRRCGKRCWP